MKWFEMRRKAMQERQEHRDKANALLKKAQDEKRGNTAEEATEIEKHISAGEKLTLEIQNLDRQIELEARGGNLDRAVSTQPEVGADIDPSAPGSTETRNTQTARYTMNQVLAMSEEQRRKAVMEEFQIVGAVLRGDEDSLTPEQRSQVRNHRLSAQLLETRGLNKAETRSMLTSPGSYAGVLISPLLHNEILMAQREALGMIEAGATIIRTNTGADYPIPYNDDTTKRARIVGEGKSTTEESSSFGQKTVKVFKYTSDYFRISLEMMQDSNYDLLGFLSTILAGRFGRAWAEDFVTGNGASAPEGIVTAIDNIGSNAYVNAAANTAITDDDLWNLKMGVNPASRAAGKYMGSDEDYARVMKIKDSNGHYTFRPDGGRGVTGGGNPIHGSPWATLTNANSAALAANQTRILFGNPKAYVVRDVMDMVLFRNDFSRMESGEVSFVAFARKGGGYPNPAGSAATQPIKALRMP